jgi:two-component system, NtrC family, sensor kinase
MGYPSAHNRRILLIDDMRSIHEDFARILVPRSNTSDLEGVEATLFGKQRSNESWNFQLDSAYQGSEGLNLVQAALKESRPYAVAFVDMRMPSGWDGLETIERLWQVDPLLQVVLCTAYSDHPWEQVLQRLNVEDSLLILKKPFDPIEVTQLARTLATKWDMARQAAIKMEALEQAVSELARSNHDLKQFAYVASHDLTEPLRMVTSYTQLLARRYGAQLDGDGRDFMSFIIDGTQRMKHLIDDLLMYSRAGLPMAPREISLDVPLDEALANLAHAIQESKARVERPAALPTLACEKTGITQVFQNLISNALKFRGEAPVLVRIEARQDDAGWTLGVVDNGIGIAPEHFERIFVIFQRLHSRSAYEGTGIGLSICKKVVERHGGTIWVESTPGQGTAVRFRLPAPQGLHAAR